jgi:dynein heavy chain
MFVFFIFFLSLNFRNILDNTELIETLENTKTKVNEVIQALNLGERTRQDIEKLRDTYRLAARRGAVLYFSLVQMSLINSMVRPNPKDQSSYSAMLNIAESIPSDSRNRWELIPVVEPVPRCSTSRNRMYSHPK